MVSVARAGPYSCSNNLWMKSKMAAGDTIFFLTAADDFVEYNVCTSVTSVVFLTHLA